MCTSLSPVAGSRIVPFAGGQAFSHRNLDICKGLASFIMQKYRVLLSSRVFVDSMLFEVVLWMGRGRFLKGMNFPKTRTKIAPQTAQAGSGRV
jgi:hypothetical protein